MDTIELKFKLDIIFGYILPLTIIIGFGIYYGILCLISYLIKKYKKKGD